MYNKQANDLRESLTNKDKRFWSLLSGLMKTFTNIKTLPHSRVNTDVIYLHTLETEKNSNSNKNNHTLQRNSKWCGIISVHPFFSLLKYNNLFTTSASSNDHDHWWFDPVTLTDWQSVCGARYLSFSTYAKFSEKLTFLTPFLHLSTFWLISFT